MGNTTSQTLQITLTTDGEGNVTASLGNVAQKIRDVKPASDEAVQGLQQINSAIEGVKRILEALGIYEVLKEAVGGFLEANAAAQQFQATLIAVTGSAQEAKSVYGELEEIAVNSSSTTEQLVGAYTRLRNAGLTPTNELLTSMANIAVGTGTTVDQVANAMAMAYEGNARGLKQLGIVAKEAGDQIIVSFQGQKTVIDNNAQGLTDFFNKFGQSDQFIAAQQASVNSLGGAWHQFWKQLEEDATTGNGILGGTVDLLTKLLQGATALAKGGDRTTPQYFYNQYAPQTSSSAGPGGFASSPSVPFDQANQQTQQNLAILKQIADATGVANAATEAYKDTLGNLISTLKNVVSEHQAENAELANSEANTALANAGVQKLIDSLSQKAASIGKNTEQSTQAALASKDMAAADDDHKRAALDAARAVDAATASEKARRQAQADAAADKSLIQSLQQQVAAFGQDAVGAALAREQYDLLKVHSGAAAEQVTALTAQLIAQINAQKEMKDQQTEDDSLQKLLDELDPVSAAYQKYRDELALLRDELDKGKISQDDYTRAVRDLGEGLGDTIDKADKLGQSLKQIEDELDPAQSAFDKLTKQLDVLSQAYDEGRIDAQKYLDYVTKAFTDFNKALANTDGAKAVLQTWEQVGNDIGNSLSKLMTDGLKNGGKDLLSMSQSIAKDLQDYWIKQKIIIPLESKLSGDGGMGGSSGIMAGAGALFQASSEAEAGHTGAAIGSLVGAAIGTALDGFTFGMGTFIGSMLGGLVGGLFDSTKTPSFSIAGNGSFGKGGSDFSDDLGVFGITGKHVNDDMTSQVESKIEQFDDALASLIPPDLVDDVKNRISQLNNSFTGSSPESVEKAHLDAVIASIDPQFQAFVDGISGIDNELKAFTGLKKLQDDLKSTQSTIIQLSGTPLEKLTDSLKTALSKITDAQSTLASALKTQDPTQIVSAEETLKKAITDRYSTEIQDVQNLIAAEQSLEQSSYSLNLSIAQKIASISGDSSNVVQIAAQRMSDLKSQIESDTDYGDALNKLSELKQATDDWLSAAQQQIQDNFSSQIQAIEDQKSAIQQQSQADSQAAQAARQHIEELRQARIAALQKQLQLAQAWLGVLQNAQQLIQSLQTGASNPLGGFSQLDLLNQIITTKMAAVFSETGQQQATDASAALADLQQRLQLIQQGNLYDRSSPEYLAAYNQTLQQIAAIQALADPMAKQVDGLQKQIDALQAVKSAVSSGFSGSNSAINALNQQEDDLKKQEQQQLDALNKQASDYYKWEQSQAQTLEDERHKEIMDQLNAITGGVDPTQFIAEESSNMAASLESIDSQITAFLNSISGGSYTGSSGGSAGGSGGGGGTGGGGSTPTPARTESAGSSPQVSMTVNVNATGMSADDVGTAVVSHLKKNMSAITTAVKRGLKTS